MARRLLTGIVVVAMSFVWTAPAYADDVFCLIHWSEC